MFLPDQVEEDLLGRDEGFLDGEGWAGQRQSLEYGNLNSFTDMSNLPEYCLMTAQSFTVKTQCIWPCMNNCLGSETRGQWPYIPACYEGDEVFSYYHTRSVKRMAEYFSPTFLASRCYFWAGLASKQPRRSLRPQNQNLLYKFLMLPCFSVL